MQWIRSLVFNISMYVAMLILAIVFFPFALFSRNAAFLACHTYCRYVIWTARWMVGLRSEVRGTPPTGEVMVAAKHQSFLDILLIFHAIPRGKFIMKRELLFAPLIGQYAWRIGCVPVDRGRRGQAIAKMLSDVAAGLQSPGQLVIYPQGTRVPPGEARPYKIGTALLYQELGQPCVPVATNVGVFWPKRAILRKPGLAVVEFLDPIAPGLRKDQFMDRMSGAIERRSNALMAEAGFTDEVRDGVD
ncbi:lysophospholipid acyltransferase family protein [Palleronia sp. KMU-117]|uniref:lysophospholipid acyltransferase family protein n=1 Tax=Palleronia sp. KMU-117 TaxID=3434108 RepID=UPI003D7442C7